MIVCLYQDKGNSWVRLSQDLLIHETCYDYQSGNLFCFDLSGRFILSKVSKLANQNDPWFDTCDCATYCSLEGIIHNYSQCLFSVTWSCWIFTKVVISWAILIVFRILTRFAHMFENMTLVTVSPPEYDTLTVSPQEIMMLWARFLQILDMPIW